MTINKRFNHLIGITLLTFAIIAYYTPMAAKEITQQLNQKLNVLNQKSHIVFLITEDPDNYEAHKTVPLFAEMLQKEHGYKVTVLLGKGTHGAYSYPNFETVAKADLLIIFARRIALPHAQMNAIKNHLHKGKPLIGIRTANHAFTVREKVQDGFEDWPAFVADVLGCKNRGYGPAEPGTNVSIVSDAIHHPIVKNIPPQWHSNGNIYLVTPLLDTTATALLTGKINDITEPIAWIRMAGKSKIFYTSLGYPDDFKTGQFPNLLINGIKWALQKSDH